ncbi:MAG: hypothetical protein WCF61_16435 [Terriglobales bacterium]
MDMFGGQSPRPHSVVWGDANVHPSTADALEADLQEMLQIAHRLRALLSS